MQRIVDRIDVRSALHFATTSKTIREAVASRIDEVARREMEQLHPWMLPFTPRELRYWESRQVARTETNDEQSKKGSIWLSHMKACLQSPTCSIRNRRRIWRSATSIFHEAKERGLLEKA
ncbi:hypothetical protein FA10DRAFT_57778 [Acaromyces ingoldii]|uniref:Uncharacterized protein n=1 Tax=Acaromyces ingoldii TaxID=215250 RepID=A0A316YAX2_9BASI|nr:hypothetical protein FA10DRAFT_57778 [Acaromyces ingoldii]PWN86459.1 hypothetical protein FA10DRAFT_57778 [Acaromyces ingoldii]